jgi:hypothetical protein
MVFGEYKTYLEASQGWVQLNVSAAVVPPSSGTTVSAAFQFSISTPGATVCVDNAALTEVDGKPQEVSKALRPSNSKGKCLSLNSVG